MKAEKDTKEGIAAIKKGRAKLNGNSNFQNSRILGKSKGGAAIRKRQKKTREFQ